MGYKHNNIELYCGPQQVGAADDLEQILIQFIQQAKKRLDIAVQELESRAIAQAIIEAKQRGVKIRLVIEQHYLRSNKTGREPWTPSGKHEENRQVHDAILRANIDVKCDYNSHIFHQKFIIRDSSSVLTGSTNFTPTGTDNNLNHLVILHDQQIARIYSKEFKEIQSGRFGKQSLGHKPIPSTRFVSGVPIKILFAPDHAPEMEIMKQMLKARHSIDFAIFTFSKSSGIDDALFRLLELEIAVTGVFDGAQGAQSWSPIAELAAKGAKLYAVNKQPPLGKLHHKLMIIDRRVVIAGSFNYTGPANRLNDENIVVIGEINPLSEQQRVLQESIAGFFKKEIDRIINVHGNAI